MQLWGSLSFGILALMSTLSREATTMAQRHHS